MTRVLEKFNLLFFVCVMIAVVVSPAMGVAEIIIMGGANPPAYYNDTWNSTDNGATWTLVNASSGWTERYSHTSVAMPDGSIVLMGGWDGSQTLNDTWRSADHGITWTQITASAEWTARSEHSSVVMPDGSIVLMGGREAIGGTRLNDTWRSIDGGATWTQQTASAGWTTRYDFKSVVTPDGVIILMGGYVPTVSKEVWQSTDYGVSWVLQNASAGWGTRSEFSAVALAEGSVILMGGSKVPATFYNDTWISADNGVLWIQENASAGWLGRNLHNSVAMPDGGIVLMGGQTLATNGNDTWRSTDKGITWTQMNASSGWTKRFSPASVVILDPPPTSLPNTIYGLVLDDNTGFPVNGATVNIHNATHYTTNLSFHYAGFDGVYWFENLPANENYFLNATKLLYTKHADVIVNTGVPGSAIRQDLYLTPAYTLTLNIRDITSSALITSVPVGIVYTGGSTTTSTGTAIISSLPPGYVSINATAAGYYPYVTSFLMSGDLNATIYMTPLSTPVSNIFYTPWQVRIQIVDYYQNPLPGTNVTANYIATTLPSTNISWLINAFAVSPTVATEMTNSGIAMAGQTDSNGGLNFAMFKSIAYNLWIFNATSGVNVNQTLYPADQEYRIRVPLASQMPVNNTLSQMSKTSLPVYQLNASCYNLSLVYEDLSGLTTGLWFKVWARNGTYFLNTDEGNPGTSMVVDNFTICYQPMGTEILWGYGAERLGT